MALGGGEDYELLCAAPPDVIARAAEVLDRIGTPLTVVGRLVERSPELPIVMVLDAVGRPFDLEGASWDHFRAR
jgi:thiamine-monophosphate kinase